MNILVSVSRKARFIGSEFRGKRHARGEIVRCRKRAVPTKDSECLKANANCRMAIFAKIHHGGTEGTEHGTNGTDRRMWTDVRDLPARMKPDLQKEIRITSKIEIRIANKLLDALSMGRTSRFGT